MSQLDDQSMDSTQPSSPQEPSRTRDADAPFRSPVEPTAAEPSNQEAWIGRVGPAQDLREEITSLNRALGLNPADGFARRALHACMQKLLARDARLAYRGETSTLYQLRTPAQFEFTHPKDREPLDPYPPVQASSADTVYRWLKWSVIGLIPAGVGTILLAPVAIVGAVTRLRHPLGQSDSRRMWAAIFCGAVLWIAALALVFLLALHMS